MPMALAERSESESKFFRVVIPFTEIYVKLKHFVAEYLSHLPFDAVLLDV